MEESKCPVHGLSRVTSCNWCGDSICEQCLVANSGRKYCPRCYTKLAGTRYAKVMTDRDTLTAEARAPNEKIKNIDPTLTEEEIEKKQKMLQIKEKAKKILGRPNQ